MRNSVTFESCLLQIDTTLLGVEQLPHLIDRHDSSAVYLGFEGRPSLDESRELIERAVRLSRAALPEVPHPVYVGLAAVDPAWRDAFQRAMAMDGVGGFSRESAAEFAKASGSRLVDARKSSKTGRWAALSDSERQNSSGAKKHR